MIRRLLFVCLLTVATPGFAAEPTNPMPPLAQPPDREDRHWTARRWFAPFELRMVQTYRLVDLSSLDALQAIGASSAGSADATSAAAASSGSGHGHSH